MLKPALRPLLGSIRRPASCAVALLPGRCGIHSTTQKQAGESESRRQDHPRERRRKPVLLASALSATATTIGAGALVFAVSNYDKDAKETGSQYASRAEMELVRPGDDDELLSD